MTPARRAPGARELAVALAPCTVATAIVFSGALGYFFSQDDFQHLARALGVIPRPFTPFRPVANLGWFAMLWPLAGLNPVPYHAASLALHAIACTLAYGYLRRFHARGAAALGIGWFAVHPALYTALYWVSAVNVPLMWGFALAALHAERGTGPRRWLAVPLLALALLTRESAVVVPLLAIAVRAHERSLRARDPVLLAMVAVAVADAAWLAALDVFGVRAGSGAASAYHMALGPHVLANFLSYAGWSLNFVAPTVRAFGDAIDPGATPWAIAALAAWCAGACVPALRRGGWLVGGAWFVLLLLPVLPLAHHTYHYYLYGPLLGGSWCLAAAYAALAERRTSARKDLGRELRAPRATTVAARRVGFAGIAIAVVIAGLAANGAALVRTIERHPFVEGLRSDPTVDRAIIARNVRDGLAAAVIPPGTALRFWSPTAIGLAAERGADPAVETYWERNVRQALFDGLAVLVLFPRVGAVSFVRAFDASDRSPWYAVYRVNGALGVATVAQLDSILRAHAESTPR